MGSKNRHAKEILPIILKDRKLNQYYVEPFCGGCNMIDKVPGGGYRIANDQHYYLIEMWKAIQSGWVPPENISEEEYNDIKLNKCNYSNYLIGYVGFNLSYGAMWFSSYRKDSVGKRNYSKESFRAIIKQIPLIKDVVFNFGDYLDLEIPCGSIIYCDPPYKNTASYKNVGAFDHDTFWEYTRFMSKRNSVFVSEYNAPDDFISVWQKEVNSSLTKETGSKKAIEKLFVYNKN